MHTINGGDVVEEGIEAEEGANNSALEGSGRRKRHNVVKEKYKLWPNKKIPWGMDRRAKFTDDEYVQLITSTYVESRETQILGKPARPIGAARHRRPVTGFVLNKKVCRNRGVSQDFRWGRGQIFTRSILTM